MAIERLMRRNVERRSAALNLVNLEKQLGIEGNSCAGENNCI